MNENADPLLEINRRLDRIERALGLDAGRAPVQRQQPVRDDESRSADAEGMKHENYAAGAPVAERERTDMMSRLERGLPAHSARRGGGSSISLATVMALIAGIALVLAAVYFVRLVYVAGWLTPGIQVGLALLTGIALIVGGEQLARHDRQYAAFMPAAGIIVLFLAVFAAHLYYALIPMWLAVTGVAASSLTGIWLSRQFNNSVYAVFSAVGVYLTPLFIPALRAELLDLVIYFTAWSLLFSFAALTERRRTVYLVALFLALIGFDLAWRSAGSQQWALAALYQFAQFLIFAITAGAFSVMNRRPMTGSEALVHGIGLFYFYFLEYVLLKQNAPELAPWIALASVVVVLLLYFGARRLLRDEGAPQASAALASTYSAVVTAQVVFFDLTPDRFFSLAALLIPAAALLLTRMLPDKRLLTVPPLIVSGAVFSMGLFNALVGERHAVVGSQGAMLLLYATVLYAAFVVARRDRAMYGFSPLLLIAGHIATLIATSMLFDSGLLLSLIWATLAVALLVYAVRRSDTLIGRSSLLIFAASGIKVLVHDLTGSAPAVRIVVLVVLAVSLYVGGWLYQRMSRAQERFHPNDEINRQLNVIAGLVKQGMSNDGVVECLRADGVACLAPGGEWTTSLISEMRRDYGFRQAREQN